MKASEITAKVTFELTADVEDKIRKIVREELEKKEAARVAATPSIFIQVEQANEETLQKILNSVRENAASSHRPSNPWG